MVLVDTSVWVSHLRDGNAGLENLLNAGEVACHQFIIGELACGNLKNREEILTFLSLLPDTASAGHDEVIYFIENNHLAGKGLGYIDVHLLASALINHIPVWTLDRRLREVSSGLGLRYQ